MNATLAANFPVNAANYGAVPNHQIDPVTGFLQSPAYATAFDGETKRLFLMRYHANGLRFKKTCRELSVSEHTVHHHFQIDSHFKSAFEEVERDYAENLQCTSMEVALTPKGFMDRIAQLRRLFPGKYAPAVSAGPAKIEIHVEGNLVAGGGLKLLETAIDAEIADPTPTTPEQLSYSPTENDSSRELSPTEDPHKKNSFSGPEQMPQAGGL